MSHGSIASLPITLYDVERRLNTHPVRVRQLIAARGIEPGRVGKARVISEEQFEVIKRDHLDNPPRPRGNPTWAARTKAGPDATPD